MDRTVSKWTGPPGPPNPTGGPRGLQMDKGFGGPPTLQMDRAISKLTKVGGPRTFHDLKRLPNLRKWARGGGAFNLSGLGGAAPNPSLKIGKRNPICFMVWALSRYGWFPSKPKIGKSMTGPFGPERTPHAKPKLRNQVYFMVLAWFLAGSVLARCE